MTQVNKVPEGVEPPEPPVVQLTSFFVKDAWKDNALRDLSLSLAPGRAYHLTSDSISSAHLLLRSLATLDWPWRGTYRFQGEVYPFISYQTLLPLKRRIGYIYPRAAMVRNRTVEENLDYQVQYFGDIELSTYQSRKEALVKGFALQEALPFCPELVSFMAQRRAIVTREFLKEPLLFLAEYPEEFVGHGNFALFIAEVHALLLRGGTFVYTTNFRGFGKELNPMGLRLENGTLFKEQSL